MEKTEAKHQRAVSLDWDDKRLVIQNASSLSAVKAGLDEVSHPQKIQELSILSQTNYATKKLLLFTNIMRIHIVRNNRALPDWITGFPRLEEIEVWYGVTALPPHLPLTLRSIRLKECGLTTFPPQLRELPHLTDVWLDSNQIRELPDWIGELKNLTFLCMSHNLLTSLPASLSQLTGLEIIHLQNNRLSTFPPQIRGLTQLELIFLEGNSIEEVPYWIKELTKLKKCNLVEK